VDLRRFKQLASGTQAGGSRMYLLLACHLVEALFNMDHDDARLNAISNDKTARVGGRAGLGVGWGGVGVAAGVRMPAGLHPGSPVCCYRPTMLRQAPAAWGLCTTLSCRCEVGGQLLGASPLCHLCALLRLQVVGRTGAGDELPQLLQELGQKHHVKLDLSALLGGAGEQQQEEEAAPAANGAAKPLLQHEPPLRQPLRPTPNTASGAPRAKAEPAARQAAAAAAATEPPQKRDSAGREERQHDDDEEEIQDQEELVQLVCSAPPSPAAADQPRGLAEPEDVRGGQQGGDVFIDYIDLGDD
jgi:hypothetical protein